MTWLGLEVQDEFEIRKESGRTLTLLWCPLRVLVVTAVCPLLLIGLSTTGIGSGSTSGSGSSTRIGAGAMISDERSKGPFNITHHKSSNEENCFPLPSSLSLYWSESVLPFWLPSVCDASDGGAAASGGP